MTLYENKITILIGGKAGAGKSTVAKHLAHLLLKDNPRNLSVCIHPFAKYLKEVAQEVGWDGHKDDRGRTLLQKLGQIVREYDIDFWVRYTLQAMVDAGTDVALIDDWRFPNEEKYMRENPAAGQVVTIYINDTARSLTGEQGKEVSENSLLPRADDYDYYLDNEDGTVADLYELLRPVAEQVLGVTIEKQITSELGY